jgi:hypothetical protein
VLPDFAAPDDEEPPRDMLLRDAPRDPPRFAAPRFIVLFFAEPRFDERFVALFELLRFAPPRFVALFLELLRFAVPFFAPERFRTAGPRRVLFFPALRFMPRPDFFVAIAASPPPGVIVGAARIVRRVAQIPGAPTRRACAQNMAARDVPCQHELHGFFTRLPATASSCTIGACSRSISANSPSGSASSTSSSSSTA